MPEPLPFSVVILTLNEEARLPACLASVAGCNDVVVVDSGSTDATQAMARAAGARVLENRFVNFAEQRNFAHTAGQFLHSWVFHLDADELMTPALLEECRQVAQQNPPCDGFYAAPRMMFHGRWLRHCTDYPAWQARLVMPGDFPLCRSAMGSGNRPGCAWATCNPATCTIFPRVPGPDGKPGIAAMPRGSSGSPPGLDRFPAINEPGLGSRGLERRRALKHLSYYLPRAPASFCLPVSAARRVLGRRRRVSLLPAHGPLRGFYHR